MEVAAAAVTGSLLGKLGDLLADKYKLLKETKGEITSLKAELESMHAFLKKMSDVEEPDEQAKCWVKEVRELSYDIEDGVDEFMLRVEREYNSKPHGFKGFIDRSIHLLTTINTRHKIAMEFQGLKGRVMEVSERRKRYSVDDAVSKPNNTTIDPRLLALSASQGAKGSLLGKLGDLLADKYKLHKETKGNIMFLKAELESMHALLTKMSNVEEPDEQAKCWVKEVRDLSSDIEDGVNKFMLRVERESNSKPHGFKGFIDRSINLLTTINTRHKIAMEFHGLKGRVMEVSERRKRYSVDDAVSKPNNTTIDPRLLALYAETTGLAGIEGPREQLIQLMMDEEGVSAQQLKVLSIVGFGGLGKTTLARDIYHKLESQFQCRAFVSVSQKPNLRKMFRNILSQVGYVAPEQTNMEVWDEDELISTLQKFLTDKRYIIVIDDIWDAIAWNIIRFALPENKNGSRVITTTRIQTLATTCCSNHYDYVYKMRPLSSEDSRMLFFNRVFGSEDACPPNLGEVSAEILKRCGGLPLTIITISNLLASQGRQELEHWERVLNSLSSNFEVNPTHENQIRQILSLSYKSLPHCLKTCMLYLGVYPEDYKIDKYDLVRQWVAQGFISKELGRDPEDVAEGYFNELVNMSIIQPVDTDVNDDVLSCRVHDIMLDFIIHKCREENFITAIDDIQDITGLHDKIRRLSLLDGVTNDTTLGTIGLSQVRALTRFGTYTHAPGLLEFKHLRVLRLEFPSRNRESVIPDLTGMCQLFQLRYLKVVAPGKIALPSKIRGLQQLETLDLRGSSMVEVPSDVVHLRRLLHLIVPSVISLPGGIGDMKSLRTLRAFLDMSSIDNIRDLGYLTNLRDLDICFRGEKQLDDMAARCRDILRSSLEKLSNLKYLSIGHDFPSIGYFFPQFAACWDELSSLFASLPLLQRLHTRCTFSRVPKQIGELHNLYDLMLWVKEVREDDVGILAQLQSLIRLHLHIGGTPGEKVVIRGMGFPVLKHFRIACSRISYLTFEAGAMPKLQRLHLSGFNARSWHKYGAAPVGIEHLSGLKEISAQIGGYGAKESNRRAAQSALRDAIDVHPGRPTANIECPPNMGFFFERVENDEKDEDENVNSSS